jgi:hypothetical protein
MDKPDDKPTTLEERLIGAFISAIAMACTIAVLSFVFFVMLAKGRFEGVHLLFHFVFSKASLFIIAATAVLGFFLSFDKMADIFSSLWGTHPVWEEDWMQKLAIAIVITIATGAVAYYLLSR